VLAGLETRVGSTGLLLCRASANCPPAGSRDRPRTRIAKANWGTRNLELFCPEGSRGDLLDDEDLLRRLR
jgi:hypothetical protein